METEQLFHPSRGLGAYKEVVVKHEATIIPMFRNGDPVTSKIAGKSASKRSPSQQMIILRAFASGRGFTDEEVGDFTGLSANRRCCYWKRCSELRTMGFIVTTGDFAKSSAGELQRICKITALGQAHLQTLGE